MPLTYIGKTKGFASRTFSDTRPSPLVEALGIPIPKDKWRSPVTQDLVFADLQKFNNTNEYWDQKLERAILITKDLFKTEKVKMLHLNDVFQQELDIWSRSPGLPWRDLGYKTKGDVRNDPDAVQSIRRFWHYVKLGRNVSFPDCCAYVRSHVTDYGKEKVRAIWGYPATVTFGEAMFAIPLIREYQKKKTGPIAYNFEMYNGGARKILRWAQSPAYAALDFKNFDKTVPAHLIRVAFGILAQNIDFGNYEGHGVADSSKNFHMFERIVDYFINTKIRLASGHRYRKSSGVASGSYFTQLVDSIVNCILCNWVSLNISNVPVVQGLYLGDDSFLGTSRKWSLCQVRSLLQKFEMELNIEKSEVALSPRGMVFLGYNIGHGIPFKERSDWLAALAYPENPDRSWDDLASRALGLYHANMCVDDYIAYICEAIISLRPFDLNLTSNFERLLRHIGVDLNALNPMTLPTNTYFRERLK